MCKPTPASAPLSLSGRRGGRERPPVHGEVRARSRAAEGDHPTPRRRARAGQRRAVVSDDDGFDDVVSDEEVDAAYRKRLLYDDELFEREWELNGPKCEPLHSPPFRSESIALDNPWRRRPHLAQEEEAAQERFKRKRKKRNPLMRGRY